MQRRRVVFALVVTLCGLLGSAGTGRADEDTALVAKWYRAYLKREPGTSVLEAYASELKNGTPGATFRPRSSVPMSISTVPTATRKHS